ncbi:MAG: hypothetical protein ABIH22_03765 [Candidatus Margulisiibacteriota bacterium]
MKKIITGLLFGAIIGLVNEIPHLILKQPLFIMTNSFIMWLAIGFLIAVSNINLNSVLKGVLISSFIILPVAILLNVILPEQVVPMISTNLILGGLLGYLIGRFGPK